MIELNVIDAAPQPSAAPEPDRVPKERFFRGAADLVGHPDQKKLAQQEFMPGASDPPTTSSRRTFLKVSGALMAMGGLAACRRPETHILPYARKPEEVVPGVPQYYATAMPYRGSVQSLLVESHEGRPTKAEGNPEHPVSQGATSGFAQASVLNLYDPDRSGTVLRDGAEASWDAFRDFASTFEASASSRTVAVLAEESSSPTRAALRAQMEQRYPGLRWITYAAEGDDPGALGMQQAFGRPLRPLYDFSEARVIVSLDADFLGPTAPGFVPHTRTFAASRRLATPEDEMSRLYMAESGFSLTGGQADHRVRMQASRIPALAAAVAAELGVGSGQPSAQFTEREQLFAREMARDLQEAGAQGVILAGDTQPPEVHALCAAINGQLGSQIVTMLDAGAEPRRPQDQELADLIGDMQRGQIDALLMLGVNPVHDLPDEMNFAEALGAVDETIHLGLHIDETARESRWHLPRAHYLEAWGDGRAYDGTLSVIQPLIAPLYDDAHSELEVLSALAPMQGRDGSVLLGSDALVRETWRGLLGGASSASADGFENAWDRVLHDGFLPDTGYPAANAGSASAAGPSALQMPQEDEIEVVFRLDPALLAGEYANNAWMQELPDPTTKITWDNVALMSPKTADALGLEVYYDTGQYYADVLEITAGDRRIELPVWIQHGYPDGSVGVNFGYGRHLTTNREAPQHGFLYNLANAYEGIYERSEPLANGVGTNVAPLRSPHLERVVVLPQSNFKKTGGDYMLASTQEHGSMEGRPLVRRSSMEEYRQNPNFARDQGEEPLEGADSWEDYPMLWEDNHPTRQDAYADSDYYQNQWGMVIDLNTCTGCNACVVACNSENNVQVVGKDEVSRGREMHWLRIDRYFAAPNPASETENSYAEEVAPALNAVDQDAVEMVVQPVMCQHCENAPCESVCPVAATVHTPDGMNQMIYNRCIGTRYCSNNCPYKVRRFNFYNWTKSLPTEVQMAQNPNVTMRFRGVMEKCSWCVQRIREAQSRANLEDRSIEDGEILTACQQACPANAITFGDLNDPYSAVSELKENSRRYEMLAELNVKPRLSYLGRVSNPNPRLAPARAEAPEA